MHRPTVDGLVAKVVLLSAVTNTKQCRASIGPIASGQEALHILVFDLDYSISDIIDCQQARIYSKVLVASSASTYHSLYFESNVINHCLDRLQGLLFRCIE